MLSDATKGSIWLSLLVLQSGAQPILSKLYVSPLCLKAPLVIVSELAKIVLYLTLIAMQRERMEKWWKSWTLSRSLLTAAPPAGIYAIQNLLIQTSFMNLEPLWFSLINQIKLLFTALFCYWLLGRPQTKIQIVALLILIFAIVLLTTDVSDAGHKKNSFWFGVVPLLIASTSSGLAAALCQKATQIQKIDSIGFSFELAIYGLIILLAFLFLGPEAERLHNDGFFLGWTDLTCIPVLATAVGGFIVGEVTKYAGGVKKGIAVLIGMTFTALLNALLFSAVFSFRMKLSLPLVAFATLLHTRAGQAPVIVDKVKKES